MGKEFGLSEKQEIWKEYIGQYVIIYPANSNNTFSGRLVATQEGYAILNPHQSGIYDKKRGRIRRIIDENSKVNLMGVAAIEPTHVKI